MTTFRLPDLGEGLMEAEIIAWHVSVGDRVHADQPLVSVETDKAVVEIPSPHSGVIERLYGEPGDLVAVGAPLVDFAAEARSDSGTVVGELPEERPHPEARGLPSKTRGPRTEARGPRPRPETRGGVLATPAVRALAHERDLDLTTIVGTGPEGAITSEDVRAAAEAKSGRRGQPLRGVRRSMAKAMARSREQVVPATVHDVAKIDAWAAGSDPTLRLIRAIVAGLRAEPLLNNAFDAERGELIEPSTIDLGIALDRPEGLYVPVLRNAGELDDSARRAELERLKQAVTDRSIAPADLASPSFTLSNFGMLAGRHASLVIVPPQVAILGAGRIEEQVFASDGVMQVGRMLPLSLTFDHRVITGGEAARFLSAVITDLQDDEDPLSGT